jgi:hypothetical protein
MDIDPRDSVVDLLKRIRDIASLEDNLALDELAELVEELRFGVDWERQRARESLAGIRSEADYLTSAMNGRVPFSRWWSGRELLERLQDLGSRWSPDVRRQFAGDIAELRQHVEPIARAAAIHGAVSLIESARTEQIVNTMLADRLLRDVDAAEGLLREMGAADTYRPAARAARERVARYRWRRRMDEAEVSEAGGNIKKATRQRAEARVLLRQDWLRALPNESPPEG